MQTPKAHWCMSACVPLRACTPVGALRASPSTQQICDLKTACSHTHTHTQECMQTHKGSALWARHTPAAQLAAPAAAAPAMRPGAPQAAEAAVAAAAAAPVVAASASAAQLPSCPAAAPEGRCARGMLRAMGASL
eukprot:1139927-Pelagomonas_calceolata.AAC.5